MAGIKGKKKGMSSLKQSSQTQESLILAYNSRGENWWKTIQHIYYREVVCFCLIAQLKLHKKH